MFIFLFNLNVFLSYFMLIKGYKSAKNGHLQLSI